jgi:hypothetical protein
MYKYTHETPPTKETEKEDLIRRKTIFKEKEPP